ncbi:DUF6443 domain-containing protein [Flavobacterium ajazii]|uniref:DUF6443 domain-containing protein n=1 Tax=Flavobacterium ajazii TaxID=2692318 RepID=UPI0013CF870B|nr:DUF6443 domain-containing protein [Flavobacterium ajazii]
MKKYILLILLSFTVMSLQSQTFSDDNFIYTVAPKKAVKTAELTTLTKDQVTQNVTYFDGLGRPVQTISINQGANGENIVTPIEYDPFGRQEKEYLPYAVANGGSSYLRIDAATALNDVTTFYNKPEYDNTSTPFSQKLFESSPLNRVQKQAAPGASWEMNNGHEIKLDYQTNTAEEVKLYKATASWDSGSGLYQIAFTDAGYYAKNELYKNITYDENTAANPSETSGSTVEFKNKEGQVILKRTYDLNSKHDTYYVYDIYGNLTYVIPPKAEGTISQEILDGLCYQYKYDDRNRLVEKKLPGKQWEFIVYDKLDRPVATGPAVSPFKDETAVGWIITKYDVFGRPVYTGWNNTTCNAAARNTLQTAQNSATVLFETKQTSGSIDGISANYSNAVAPTSFKLLTVNYYDNYVYPNAPSVPTDIEGQTVLVNVKTLATGSWTRAITIPSSTAGETGTTFYDDKGRPIRIYTQNHLGGYTYSDSKLDFVGKAQYTVTKHKYTSAAAEITVREEFTYSAQDRLLTHTHQINGGTVQLMADNKYDALGQLESKKVGNSTGNPLQKVDFSYNIRGWLTGINKIDNLQQGTDPVDQFAFKINYNATQTGITDVNALYNGNISETFWKTASDATERAYGYQYDKLNRLKNAVYEKNSLTTNAYNESLTYDKNGNILSLVRNGDTDPQIQPIEIDNLGYTYTTNSNRLSKVSDSSNNTSGFNDVNKTGDDYSYDDNGNLITDKNKNITTISYNHLNLPKKIIFGTGNTIEYIYNAAGQKLEKIVKEGTVTATTQYLGGYQYKNSVLEFFPTAEGYVKNENNVLSYVFQYKDHLGNIRLSYAQNPITHVLEIIEENNYYPFGLKHKGYNDYTPTNNKFKYSSKEFQDELGLGFYDYGWRNYDPAIGRWINPDPLLNDLKFTFDHNKVDGDDEDEVYESIITKIDTGGGIYNPDNLNPYEYGYNNPVNFNDPDGRCPICPIIALAIYLLTPEPVMAPTRDPMDGKRMGEAKGAKNTVILSTIPVVRDASALHKLSNASKETGKIYKVPGEKTESGKPYIGRTKQSSPAKRGEGAKDGRDRTDAEIIDRYDPNKPGQGAYKEQKAIDEHGGVTKLDNKRNEASPKRMEALKKKYGNGK